MLVGIYGDLGSGKTLFMTYLAKKLYDKIPIYANYKINLPNVNYIEPTDLITMKYEKALILLDEAYTWLESRISLSKINRYISYIIFQSRKRGLDIVFTAQLSSSVDLRLRDLTNLDILAIKRMDGFHYIFITKNKQIFEKVLPIEIAKELYDIYDTREVIMPFGIDKLKEEVEEETRETTENEIIEEIIKQITPPKNGKITRAWIKSELIRLKKPLKYQDVIYVRLLETSENYENI